jgi:hypothetical protein
VPLILLIIVVFYRYVKQRNEQIAVAERESLLAQLEEKRKTMYEKIQAEHRQREKEISEYFERQEKQFKEEELKASTSQSKSIEIGGDSTDDEFFEMPLPPLPASEEQMSVIDNEAVGRQSSVTKFHGTPKIENVSPLFQYPPPHLSSTIPPQTRMTDDSLKMKFDPLSLPPVPPRLQPLSKNVNKVYLNDGQESGVANADSKDEKPLLEHDF